MCLEPFASAGRGCLAMCQPPQQTSVSSTNQCGPLRSKRPVTTTGTPSRNGHETSWPVSPPVQVSESPASRTSAPRLRKTRGTEQLSVWSPALRTERYVQCGVPAKSIARKRTCAPARNIEGASAGAADLHRGNAWEVAPEVTRRTPSSTNGLIIPSRVQMPCRVGGRASRLVCAGVSAERNVDRPDTEVPRRWIAESSCSAGQSNSMIRSIAWL